MDQLDAATALIPELLRDRAVFPLYQPIVDLSTKMVVGAEALARGPAGSLLESPRALFAAAARAGLMPLIDQMCFARAVEVAQQAADVPPLLFANAEPAAMDQTQIPELAAAVREPERFRIVQEFTERALATHPGALLDNASRVHRNGGAIALDDVGADPLSAAFLSLLEPDVVKLDMNLLHQPDVMNAGETAAIVHQYAERTGAVVLAEGIETERDLATARLLGARWGQGWLFGRPAPITAIAGQPIHRHARLPSQPSLYQSHGSPFSVVAARLHNTRTCDQHMVDDLAGHLLSAAPSSGSHTVVLGAYPTAAVGNAWLPHLTAIAGTIAFVGVVGPALPTSDPHDIRIATSPIGNETTLAVVGPHTTAAMCARPSSNATSEIVLTHDPDQVHAVARILMRRIGAAAPAQRPASSPPY